MQFPYQCLAAAQRSNEDVLLFGANGPNITTCQLRDGKILHNWPANSTLAPTEAPQPESDDVRPGKKRKLEHPLEKQPNVIKLVVTSDNEHLVAVTAEDKCVRVFQITPSGELEELSQRCMPKRPCALSMSTDGKSILVGDKFGDVYSIPLLPTAGELEAPSVAAAVPTSTTETPSSEIPVQKSSSQPSLTPSTSEPQGYTPAASILTVHSGSNRRALEEQLRQKSIVKTKEPLKFKHDLLLGHVSMLTDLLSATITTPDSKARNYILTSDRDEHIRISRAPPQSHIIEGFCLGHEHFISKLHLLTPQILVSGGGDDELLVWKFEDGTLLQRIPLRDILLSTIDEVERQTFFGQGQEPTFAVNGLWSHQTANDRKVLFCTCESLPFIFAFLIDPSTGTMHTPTAVFRLPGNPLDVIILPSDDSSAPRLLVSVDQQSTQQHGQEILVGQLPQRRLLSIRFQDGVEFVWSFDDRFAEQSLGALNERASAEADAKVVRDLIYGVENLRKKTGGDGGDGGEE